MRRYFLALCAGLLMVTCVSAQKAAKFGHVSTAAILEMMPEVEIADAKLAAFQEGLIKGGESKVKAFEENLKKYQEDMAAGTLSKVQQADREAALAKEQEAIRQYEAQVQLQVMQKREELLGPILKKLDEAIQAVGKEGGYTFIFDSSVSGTLLYAMDGDDLLPAIKAKLGLQ